MVTLEVRRHSLRKTGSGSQLSQQGVDLARRVGATMGPFDLVVTSVLSRTRETAVAMGFAVDHELVTTSADPAMYAELQDEPWYAEPEPWDGLSKILASGGPFAMHAGPLLGCCEGVRMRFEGEPARFLEPEILRV